MCSYAFEFPYSPSSHNILLVTLKQETMMYIRFQRFKKYCVISSEKSILRVSDDQCERDLEIDDRWCSMYRWNIPIEDVKFDGIEEFLKVFCYFKTSDAPSRGTRRLVSQVEKKIPCTLR